MPGTSGATLAPVTPSAEPYRAPFSGGRAALYWLAVGLIVSAYLVAWLSDFGHVYGWLQDDLYVFSKGLSTVNDWRSAFTAGYNANQAFFFLISYLPLASRLTLSSYPIPPLEDFTGQFRFLLLFALLLHASLLVIWGWFARQVTTSAAAAIVSLLLLASSPTYILWSPQPESRLLGMPFVLPGLWVLLRWINTRPSGLTAVTMPVAAGSLFGVAQSIHYTSLYLIAPVSIAIWGLQFFSRFRTKAYWLGVLGFALGCVWLQALIEVVSGLVLGLPWQQGPTMTLLQLRDVMHASPWGTADNFGVWRDSFMSQMGPPLLAAVAVGWILFAREHSSAGTRSRHSHTALVLGLLLAVAYLGFSGSMPFFRQTSVLQPFFFLFAGIAIMNAGRWLSPRRLMGQIAVSAVVLIVIGVTPWTQAYAVFEGHKGLGRVLEFAYANKGDHPLFMYINDSSNVRDTRGGASELWDENGWVLTYFPWRLLSEDSSLLAYLSNTPPLAASPTLYSTDTLFAEQRPYGHADYRTEPLTAQVRVFDAQRLQQTVNRPALTVQSVTSDSTISEAADPVNALSRGTVVTDENGWVVVNGKERNGWTSADSPGPHYLEVSLAQSEAIGRVQIVQTAEPSVTDAPLKISRVSDLHIDVTDDSGDYRTVWHASGLEHRTLISAEWQASPISRLRIVVDRVVLPAGTTSTVTFQNVIFPDFTVVPPAPKPLQKPRILRVDPSSTSASPSGDVVLTLQTDSAIPGTTVTFDGTPLQTVWGNDRWITATLARALLVQAGHHTIALRNVAGESNNVDFTVGESGALATSAGPDNSTASEHLVLVQISPADTHVGQPVGLQPDGSSALTLSAEHAGAATVVMFDGQPLATVVGAQDWVTALVPTEIYRHPGNHEVYLVDGPKRSNQLVFRVLP